MQDRFDGKGYNKQFPEKLGVDYVSSILEADILIRFHRHLILFFFIKIRIVASLYYVTTHDIA